MLRWRVSSFLFPFNSISFAVLLTLTLTCGQAIGGSDKLVMTKIDCEVVNPADQVRLWDFSPNGDVSFFGLMPSNLLIIGSPTELTALAPATGTVVWTNDQITGAVWYGTIPNTDYALALGVDQVQIRTLRQGNTTIMENVLHLLDGSTGQIFWNSRSLGMRTIAGNFRLPGDKRLLLYGQDSSNVYCMVAVDIITGRQVWRREQFFGGNDPILRYHSECDLLLEGHQEPLFDTDTTMFMYMEKGGLRKFNINTGEQLWVTDLWARRVPDLSTFFAPIGMSADRSVLWVPCSNTLRAVSASDGSIVWKTKARIKGQVQQIQPVKDGLLVRGVQYDEKNRFMQGSLHLVSMETGEEIWNNGEVKIRSASNFTVVNDSLLMFSRNKLLEFNIADGGSRILIDSLELKSKSDPFEISKTEEGYRILTRQEVLLFDENAQLMSHTYVKEPGTSGFLKALTTVVTVAAVAAAVATTSAAAYHTGEIPVIIPTCYPMGGYGFPKYGLTTACKDYLYMVADVKCGDVDTKGRDDVRFKGPGVAKVNKETGQVVAVVVTGDKTPTYEADETNSRLYYIDDNNLIICDQF